MTSQAASSLITKHVLLLAVCVLSVLLASRIQFGGDIFWPSLLLLWRVSLAAILLQIAAGFILTGYEAAPEIRCRAATFLVAVVLVLISTSYAACELPPYFQSDTIGYRDVVRATSLNLFVRTCATCLAPLLMGIALHSSLFALYDLQRLRSTPRNTLAASLIFAILVLGWSGMAFALALSARMHAMHRLGFQDVQTASIEIWRDTDAVTARFVRECPDDWHFLLLRANYLQEVGRTREAADMYELALRQLRRLNSGAASNPR